MNASFRSPIGWLELVVEDGVLAGLRFTDERTGPTRDPLGAASTLERYFAGDVAALRDVTVSPAGTQFQRDVWDALRTIPAGTTASYGDVARAVGRPGAVRAVGTANGANPIGIVIPCHRVVRSDGGIGGYGGGLDRKRWLLDHELRHSGLVLT